MKRGGWTERQRDEELRIVILGQKKEVLYPSSRC